MYKWNTYPTNSSSSNLWLCFGATSLNHVGHQSPGGSSKSYQRHLLIQHCRIHNGPRYWLILLDHKTGLRSWCKCQGTTGKQKKVPDNWQVNCQLANWHWQRHFHAPNHFLRPVNKKKLRTLPSSLWRVKVIASNTYLRAVCSREGWRRVGQCLFKSHLNIGDGETVKVCWRFKGLVKHRPNSRLHLHL